MATLKADTAHLLAMATCLATDDASGGDSPDESHESERSVCASTGSVTCITNHSTDAGAGLGANILCGLSNLKCPNLDNGCTCVTDGHLGPTYVMDLGAVLNYNVVLQLAKATKFHE